jgi:peptide/nickel transport system permease protein/oligopeptide transport system permease protein
MLAFVARRILVALPTLIGAYILIFLMIRFVPGDPVLVIMDANPTGAASYGAIQHRLGLDKPLGQQFVESVTNMAHGDLGTSFQNERPVSVNILDQLPDTLILAIAALLISGLIGIPSGVIAALRRSRWQDFAAMVGALIGVCAPSFWLAILLIIVFSLKLGWLPTFGVGDMHHPLSVLSHVLLPAISLGAASAGLVARVTRSSMLETMSQDYVRTARAKGLAEWRVVIRHGLRNALMSITTIYGLEAVALLSGAVITETVFARRGIGKLLIDAVLSRDYPQIQALLFLFVILAVVINIAIDVVYAVVDPRIRYR